MALINNPRVLFFDEPTAGLGRRKSAAKSTTIIDELRREKKTIVMTTALHRGSRTTLRSRRHRRPRQCHRAGHARELKARSGDKTRIEVRLAGRTGSRAHPFSMGVTDCRTWTAVHPASASATPAKSSRW